MSMSNPFENIGDAKLQTHRDFLRPGGRHTVEITGMRYEPSRKKEYNFFVDFVIIDAEATGEVDPATRLAYLPATADSLGSWCAPAKSDFFLPEIKTFFYALLGVQDGDQRNEQLNARLARMVEWARGPSNPFAGFRVCVETHNKPRKADGGPFTVHRWYAYTDPDYLSQVPKLETILASVP